MRYRITSKIEVRSENAAKPYSQSSRFLRRIIAGLPQVSTTFDYGCGKLRYYNDIVETTNTLSVVDSNIQITRQQLIFGRKSSITEYFDLSNRVSVLDLERFAERPSKFERGFCINVLSVIPFYVDRRKLLGTIFEKLQTGGECLFVVQYRNSDFSRMSKLPNARKWRDGFLIDSYRGYSFYGLISPDKLSKMVSSAGFVVRSRQLHEGSVYLWAAKPND